MDATATVSRDLTPRSPIMSNVWLSGRLTGYQLDQTSVRAERDDEGDPNDPGDDIQAGEVIVRRGHRLRPQDLGALEATMAEHGVARVA